MKPVTAGRDYLGEFASQFAALNDDILFGQVWSREGQLSPRDRSMITIAALMGAGILDQSLEGHLQKGKENGISQQELVELVTQLAFYTGWPKAWAVFAKIPAIYQEDSQPEVPFGLGQALDDPEHFTGKVYVEEIFGFDKPMLVDNVTFEPGCRNSWHIHQAGQTLLVTKGRGWYQEEGQPARELKAGDLVEIPAGVKHWHGASKDSWFSHLAIEDYSKGAPDWLEPVSDKDYSQLP